MQLLPNGTIPSAIPENIAIQAKDLSPNVSINELPFESCIRKFRDNIWISSECMVYMRLGNANGSKCTQMTPQDGRFS